MQTIRRIYQYLVAFISLEVVLWGLIELARSAFSDEIIGGGASQLAGGLSLLLVGIPVFLLHWIPAQRSAANDDVERFSRIRALFLYGALLSTLIPIVQNVLALVNRLWLQIFQLPLRNAILGSSQDWVDNLIAIVMNSLIAGYIFYVTRQQWEEPQTDQNFNETRRLFRYIWVLYALAMFVGGVSQVVQYILTVGETLGTSPQTRLANGLALLIIGAPLWAYAWQRVQLSLEQVDEQRSILRLVVLYLLSLIGVGGVLIPAGVVLGAVFRSLLGEGFNTVGFLNEISIPLSALLPLGGVWIYYGRSLSSEIALLPDTPRRAGLRRTYFYILAFFGLFALVVGLHMLLEFLIDMFIGTSTIVDDLLRNRLSASLATLIVGLPLWMQTWRPMVKEAAQEGEAGDHARRSLVRKIYLYLVLFACVIGVMVTAGGLIFELLKALLGDPASDLLRQALVLLEILILFSLVLVYQWNALRADIRLAERSLAKLHEAFPVLVLTSEIGQFTESMINALQREAKSLPVAIHLTENGAPDTTLSEAKAIILPSDLSVSPPEALRLWLKDYAGESVVVPTPLDNWHWVYGSGRELARVARQTAKIIRHMAEGEDVPAPSDTSTWRIVLYVLAGLLGLPIVFSLFGMLMSFVFD
ncbi:MAG: hypothetical protein ISR58_07795 [Anaerolineales bacterium]|nr:hypothetical protein [Chloroflexota bacterium]MBL6981079.1 hypothetical protein [Anaerolineales bacterium]